MAVKESESITPAPASAWSPLYNSAFRTLWIASVVSNTGSWMHDVGAAWLMTSLEPSPLWVSLVSTADNLPIFFLALPAGALADMVSRQKLLINVQVWMLGVAATLGILTWSGWISGGALLLFTLFMGAGSAIHGPAWQALSPELVPLAELPAAVTLGGVGINVARAIGPALGGLGVTLQGPSAVFFLNAASFLMVIIALRSLRRPAPPDALPAEHFLGAIQAGLRYVRHSPHLQAPIVRMALFTGCASATWALLPVVSRRELHLGAGGYGALVGCLGVGALAGAFVLPSLRRRFQPDAVVALGTLVFAAVTLALGFVRIVPVLGVLLVFAGMAWLTNVSSFNVAVQTAAPSWLRARALSIALLAFFGGLAIGAAIWGALAGRFDTQTALACAALGLLGGLAAVLRYPLGGTLGPDLTPSLHWPTPMIVCEPEAEQGPVLVTVEYRVDPARRAQFSTVMQELRRERLRGGAFRWGLFTDLSDPGRFVETFLVSSWIEHLRQHQRTTISDLSVEESARSFHLGPGPPQVTHLISAQ